MSCINNPTYMCICVHGDRLQCVFSDVIHILCVYIMLIFGQMSSGVYCIECGVRKFNEHDFGIHLYVIQSVFLYPISINIALLFPKMYFNVTTGPSNIKT